MQDSNQDSRRSAWMRDIFIGAGWITLGVLLRLACVEWPNFSPVAGLALLAGLTLQHRLLAYLVPMITMLVSDQFLTGYELPVMVSVYGCFLIPVALGQIGRGWMLGNRNQVWARSLCVGVAAGLSSSVLFFLITNATYWFSFEWGHRTLLQCYIDGLPFFRYTLAGDLMFSLASTTMVAGSFAWLTARRTSSVARTDT